MFRVVSIWKLIQINETYNETFITLALNYVLATAILINKGVTYALLSYDDLKDADAQDTRCKKK